MTYKTKQEILKTMQNDIQNKTDKINPFTDPFLIALLSSLASQFSELNKVKQHIINGLFNQIAERIDRVKFEGSQAIGNVIFNSDSIGDNVSEGDEFIYKDEFKYVVQNSVENIEYTFTTASTKIENNVCTVVLNTPANIMTGQQVTIENASNGFLNGVYRAEYINDVSFKFNVNIADADVTGVTVSANYGVASVIASENGEDYNISSDTDISYSGSNTDIITSAKIGSSNVINGTNTETQEEFNTRIANFPPPVWSVDYLSEKSVEISGGQLLRADTVITTVTDAEGEEQEALKLYPISKNLASVQDSLLQTIKTELEKTKPPAPASVGFIVQNPNYETVDLTISELKPDTDIMRQALVSNWQSFCATQSKVNTPIKKADIEGQIRNTRDAGGNLIQSFNLVSPTADIPATEDTLKKGGLVNVT